MTAAEFRTTRKALGLSVSQLAEALGLKSARSIRYYESGERPVSGPIEKLMLALRDGSLPHP